MDTKTKDELLHILSVMWLCATVGALIGTAFTMWMQA
jgi:hypothetical protein